MLSQKLTIKFANKYKFEILNSLEKMMLLVFPWSGASCRRGFCGRSGLGPPGRGLVAPWSVAVCCPPGVPDSEGPFVTFAPRPCAAVGTSARSPIESHGTPRGLPGLRRRPVTLLPREERSRNAAPRRSGPATAPSLLLGVTVGRAREGTREAGSGSPVQSRRPARPVLGTLAGVRGWGRPPGGSTALLLLSGLWGRDRV